MLGVSASPAFKFLTFPHKSFQPYKHKQVILAKKKEAHNRTKDECIHMKEWAVETIEEYTTIKNEYTSKYTSTKQQLLTKYKQDYCDEDENTYHIIHELKYIWQ